jgi:endonuclease/exonuclease/phosphatase (EEP) superfamily protein YafD
LKSGQRVIKTTFYLKLATWALLTLSIFSLAGKWLWSAELASHFKLQYFFLALGLFIFYLGCRNFKYIAFNFVILSINAYDIAPLFNQNETSAISSQRLTIVQFNRYITSLQDEKVFQWLSNKENEFDIVLFQEIAPSFVQGLKSLTQIYPHQYNTPKKGSFGQVLLSKKEIISTKPKPSSNKPSFHITAKIRLSQTNSLKLYGVHITSPEFPKGAMNRNSQLKIIGEAISSDPAKTIIAMGDFNVTPYSYYFSQFEKTIGLKNTMAGFGPQNSWPSLSPLDIFRIPIDHVFVSKNIQVIDRKIVPNLGSDHFPVIVKLSL